METQKIGKPEFQQTRPGSMITFDAWLKSLSRSNGFIQISPQRSYSHAEDQYDAKYGLVNHDPQEGLGLCSLLKFQDIDTSGPAIEIGCGTGYLTTGLALGYPGSDFLVTDPSAAFLRMTEARLSKSAGASARLHFAILNGDDLPLLPADLFSLITLRSTLHHILEVKAFIGACARALRPGGALAMCAEPCESGYVLMGVVAQSIPAVLQAAGVKLRPDWHKIIVLFSETMKFYCRRDIDKSKAEDKHLFRVFELGQIGMEHGLTLRYFPNVAFGDFVSNASPPPSHSSFSKFFLDYLRYCVSFELELVELIGHHMKLQLQYLDDCYRSHPGPLFTGAFLFVKETV
jgi:SAM-dependent methyltransferase